MYMMKKNVAFTDAAQSTSTFVCMSNACTASDLREYTQDMEVADCTSANKQTNVLSCNFEYSQASGACTSPSDSGMTAGAIVGIVFGVLIALGLIAAAYYLIVMRKVRSWSDLKNMSSHGASAESTSFGTTAL